MPGSNIADLLRQEMTALFGPAREYRGVTWWSLGAAVRMLEASVHMVCDEGDCEVWVADTGQREVPKLIAKVAKPEEVPEAIGTLRRYLDEYPHAKPGWGEGGGGGGAS